MDSLDGLEEFLRAISDGKSWKMRDLAEKLGWPEQTVERFCQLISEPELVYYNRVDKSVRIDHELRKLIRELDELQPSTP